MRPLRLELAGFTTFRDPEEIDFSDAPYFALVGPTGSGKSSIIDAIVFALYGCVPRLDQRSVLPVITQGQSEARVRLDFAIGDEVYTAVRVVRKTAPDRATTKEARLQRGEDVLAGDADGVTAEAERLLGLSFDEFTRCVVLPQGEFARFMHDKPAARQDLLVRLLGLDVYERMKQRANARAAETEVALTLQRERLDKDLSYATEEALAEAQARVATLEQLLKRLDGDEPKLTQLRETVQAARAEAVAAEKAVQALSAIRIPDGIERIAGAATDARALVQKTSDAADEAERAAAAAESGLAKLGDRTALQRALDAHATKASIEQQLAAARATADVQAQASEAADAAAEQAAVSVAEAEAALEGLRHQHRAHELSATLIAGEPCPVCTQTVSTVPALDTPADLERAEATLREARARLAEAEAARRRAAEDGAAAKARVTALMEQLVPLDALVAEHPDPTAVRDALERFTAADAEVATLRSTAQAVRATATQARKAVEQLEQQLKNERRRLDAARDGVAELSPPPLSHDDLAADWRALADWAAERLGPARDTIASARDRASNAEAEGKALVAAQREACTAAGIEDDGGSPRDDCLKAIERARGHVEKIELALESAKELRAQIKELEERAQVAKALGQHLGARAFEGWLLRQAIDTLVQGASQILLELSGGAYSLSFDRNRNFSVIDHRNANLERSARTLSGGETFLASLALALALSDRIAQLSANTAVRLESIFLDEGFGTLDPETLDTVASAIENLSAMNRMVGIVTHVRDLAERVPVRFEVRKGPTTSHVEKVLA